MNFRLKTVAVAVMAAGLVVSNAAIDGQTAHTAKHVAAKKAKKAPEPTIQEQLQQIRQEFQGQIDSLKSNLADKDAQLKQAQQQASDAQAAAAKAQAAVDAQQQAFTENTAAVSTLQNTVSDLKGNQVSLTNTISDETTAIKKAIANPDVIQYKGITISPAGSFLAAETVWRSAATASDINTPFTSVPLQHSESGQMSEFFGSGRQSRVALKAVGKLPNMTLTGYYEADWLSAGVTSNGNQSNSYTMRQRQLWAEAKLDNGWTFNGGQGWSLATETTAGLTRGTEILPATIDAQYEPGFVWARQYSFRFTKDFGKKFFLGAAVENAQTLNPAGSNLPSNLLIGSAGTGGGLYNGGGTAAGGALTNYSFNLAPDFIVKAAFEPGWGHWEVFGIQRSFRDRIYPTIGSAFNDTEIGGGIGGGFRGPLAGKKVTVGLKGLWGYGVGRYGSSTIADVTIRPDGTLEPLEAFSGLATLELNPNPRTNIYFNYGGDYVYRDFVMNGTTPVGYGIYSANMSGCNTEPASTSANPTAVPNGISTCAGNNKDVQEVTGGYWFNIYNGPKGRLRQGIQYSYIERDLWSGAGGAANPGGGGKGIDNMVFTSFRYYLP